MNTYSFEEFFKKQLFVKDLYIRLYKELRILIYAEDNNFYRLIETPPISYNTIYHILPLSIIAYEYVQNIQVMEWFIQFIFFIFFFLVLSFL